MLSQKNVKTRIVDYYLVSCDNFPILGKNSETPKKEQNVQELTKKLELLSDRDYDFVNRIVSKLK